ncbi:MAG TPA: hypothetical protein VHM92_09570 [Allosphingosinicella sp.]|nr:hypothetical protein [Allosphingosinicella sp.]
MKRSSPRLLLLAGAAAMAFAIPAAGQRGDRDKGPESLLPPGFGEPEPPAPKAQPEPDNGAAPAPPSPSSPAPPPPPSSSDVEALTVEDSAAADLAALAQQEAPPAIEIPESSRRTVDPVGPLTPSHWGLAPTAWGNANGRFLSGLMGRLDAPIPSRWASILLRRALLTRAAAPPQVNPVDWVADRAWLLLRMGEADGARLLVQSIDVDKFTPRLFTVAVQTALATADPAALCPLVGPGRKISDEPVWPMADAMCAALEGDAGRAGQLIDQARRHGGAGGIDLLLAEKVIGAGLNTRRAVNIEWIGVDELTSWRFGMASATGLPIPAELMDRAGPAVWAWQARAPMVPLEDRVEAAQRAATLGVFSSAALVEMQSLIGDRTDPSEISESLAGRLRRAYVGKPDDRVGAMRALWDEGKDRYGRLILTATAAARLLPSGDYGGERTGDLVASMMAAGLDRFAAAWGPAVDGLGDGGDRAWSILAVGTRGPTVDVGASRIDAFAGRAGNERARLLAAALAGLGRMADPDRYGVDVAPRSRWARLISTAARANQPATVALLAGVGLQTASWDGVPPAHLYQILSALRLVGLDYEARMIAAEAMTRL